MHRLIKSINNHKLKGGICFVNNIKPVTIENNSIVTGFFENLITSIYFKYENNSLKYIKGKKGFYSNIFWSISLKSKENIEEKIKIKLQKRNKENIISLEEKEITINNQNVLIGNNLKSTINIGDEFYIEINIKKELELIISSVSIVIY